jgi:hypothetical protein
MDAIILKNQHLKGRESMRINRLFAELAQKNIVKKESLRVVNKSSDTNWIQNPKDLRLKLK